MSGYGPDMEKKREVAAFTLWSVAFYATAIGFYLNASGRTLPALIALVVCVIAFLGMFTAGRRRDAGS